MRSKLTVGIPCYNCRKTIEKTLQSINLQTEKPYEVIFGDDCSSDDYTDILERYPDLKIRHVKLEKNSGVGFVRSVIVNETRTKFLTMIDSDDYFMHINVIKMFHNETKKDDFDMLISNYIMELPDKNQSIYQNVEVGCHGKIYNTYFMKNKDINFPDLRAHEEGFVNRAIEEFGRVVRIEDPTYFWVWNTGGITRQKDVMYEYYLEYVKSIVLTNEFSKREDIGSLVAVHNYFEQMRVKYGETERINNFRDFIKKSFSWDYKKIQGFLLLNKEGYQDIIKSTKMYDGKRKESILDFAKKIEKEKKND